MERASRGIELDFDEQNVDDLMAAEGQIEGQALEDDDTKIERGGWRCLKCNNINFADRDHCNMRKCREPRPQCGQDGEKNPGPVTTAAKFQEGKDTDPKGTANMREGDWICKKCGNVNFATRIRCNMRKCQAPREEWVCPQCKNINYKFRTVCNMRKCQAPRPPETYPDFPNYQRGYGPQQGYGMFPGMGEDFGFPIEPSSLGQNQNYPQLGALVGANLPPPGMMHHHQRHQHHGHHSGYEYRRGDMSGRDMHMSGRDTHMGRDMHDDTMPNRRVKEVREGDWHCLECGNINFANRQRCNMRKCRAERPLN